MYIVRAHIPAGILYLRFYSTGKGNEPFEQWHPAWTHDKAMAYRFDGPTLAQASLNTRMDRDEMPDGLIDQDIQEA